MKLIDTKKKIIIFFASILGLIFSAFTLYNQSGTFGQREIFVLMLTAIILSLIIFFFIKKANK